DGWRVTMSPSLPSLLRTRMSTRISARRCGWGRATESFSRGPGPVTPFVSNRPRRPFYGLRNTVLRQIDLGRVESQQRCHFRGRPFLEDAVIENLKVLRIDRAPHPRYGFGEDA